MIDEFIYQYQAFQHHRQKLKSKSEEEISMLKDCEGCWDTMAVLKLLQSLANNSQIVVHLNKLDNLGKSAQNEV